MTHKKECLVIGTSMLTVFYQTM